MEWEYFISSDSIAAIGYDKEAGVLGVQFVKTGKTYYYELPFGVYEAFLLAPSKGQFFLENIKGKPYRRFYLR